MNILRFITKSIVAVLIFFMIIWIILAASLRTRKGQDWLINHSLAQLNEQTGLIFKIDRVEFIFPFSIRVHHLSISKEQDQLVDIKRLDLNCLYPNVFQGRLTCSSLRAHGINVLSMTPGQATEPSRIPYYFKIRNIQLKDIRFSPKFLEQMAVPDYLRSYIELYRFDLSGFVRNNPFKTSMTAHMELTATSMDGKRLPSTLSLDSQNNQLSLTGYLNHLPTEQLLKDTKTNVSFFAAAPINSWNEMISSLPLTSPIEGSFKGEIDSLEASVKSKFKIHSQTDWQLSEFLVSSPTIYLEGQSRLSSEEIKQASFKGQVKELTQFPGSTIHVEGELQGAFSNLLLSLQAQADKMHYESHAVEKVHSSVTAKINPNDIQGQLNATFESNQIPCSLSTAFQWDPKTKRLELTNVNLQALQSSAKGEFTINATGNAEGHLKANDFDLQVVWPELIGKIDLTLKLNNRQLSADFSGNQLQYKNTLLGNLKGSVTHDSNERNFPFQLECYNDEKWKLLADGKLSLDQFELSQLSGTLGTFPLDLLEPIRVSVSSKEINTSPITIKWGEGLLTGQLTEKENQFDFNFKADGFSSDHWHVLNPEFPLKGFASATGHFKGSFIHPLGHIKINFHKIQIVEEIFSKNPYIDGEIDFSLTDQGMEVKSLISGVGKSPFIVNGTLPYLINLSPLAIIENQAVPFALNVEAEGELDSYLHLMVDDLPNLTGHAKLAMQLTGKPSAPQVQGSLDIENGTYESMNTGAVYRDIHAHLEGDGGEIILKGLTAEDKKGGIITATGKITLDSKQQFPFEFQIQPSHIYILDSDYASLSASGQLTLAGITKNAKLQGNLTVDQAVVHLEEALPKQIKTLDMAYLNLAEGEKPPISQKEGNRLIELDIKLNASDNVVIEGNHLKSEWKGGLQIAGTTDKPLLFGDLRIAKGEYELNGKVFDLSQGTIHFAGSAEKKTSLYVVASKEIDPIKAEMIVKGPLSRLEVSFRSNPPLAQREVLSYILFNRGISDISSGEGDRLNQSFITLNASDHAASSNMDMISKLRNNVGLDRLDFTAVGAGENKEYGLQFGKYIRDDILVSINKSINAGPDRVAVEAKLMKNLKAQAEVEIAGGAQGKVSLKWKRDY